MGAKDVMRQTIRDSTTDVAPSAYRTAEFMSRLEAGVLGKMPASPSTIIAVAALLTAIAALLIALRA